MTFGGPCIGDVIGETIVHWAAFAREHVSTRDASASWEAIADAGGHPGTSSCWVTHDERGDVLL
jgi:hypothetical protein